MNTLFRLHLERLSICPCGFGVLDDSIPIGTIYVADVTTFRRGFTYKCGGCGRIQKNSVAVINCSQQLHPERPMAPLPFGLFTI